MELVDIGCNLTHDSFDCDPEAVLARARTAGVAQMIVTGATEEGSRAALRLALDHPRELYATAGTFGTIMVPGLMAITMLMAGVQGVLIPLAQDLSGSREVDEPLLAPLGVFQVSLERIVAGAIHAAAAGLVAGPVMIALMHRVGAGDVSPRWALLLPLVAVCGLLSASFSLTLGTLVQPRFSGLLFAVVLGPMMLFGCAYYPWASLSAIGPVQYLFLLNPLSFVSEAMRLAEEKAIRTIKKIFSLLFSDKVFFKIQLLNHISDITRHKFFFFQS